MTSRRGFALTSALTLILGGPLLACGRKDSDGPAGKPGVAPPTTPTTTTSPGAPPSAPAPRPIEELLGAFAPLPAVMAADPAQLTDAKVDLGRMLYFETRLSRNHDLSCNSCHDLARFGVDGQPTSPGHKGQRGGRNSPTSYNAAGHLAQFWDGRAADVEAQALGPILNPIEMAAPSEAHVVAVLASIPEYVTRFTAAWPDDKAALSYQHVGDAIGAFERKLVTPGRWDRFLAGDRAALTAAEQDGLRVFVSSGCGACHGGAYVGGAMYQKVGAVKPWPSSKDLGRFEVSKNEADKYFFKVPSLRNIAETAPYFHDGSVADLPTAVRMMAEHQLGKMLTDGEVAAVVAFLRALTGDVPTAYVTAPTLPPSGKKTPKPDPS
ncbi:MAG: c-type cytochrome [Kofleriaceae bacterium]|nr:c-type cytochrome [Kofleriaceae bacterium]